MPPIRQPVNRCGAMTKKGLKCCRRSNPVTGFCSHHLGYTTAGGAGEQNTTTSQHAPAQVASDATAGGDAGDDQDMTSQDATAEVAGAATAGDIATHDQDMSSPSSEHEVAGATNDQDMASQDAPAEAIGVTNADDEAINDQDMNSQHTAAEVAGAANAGDDGASDQDMTSQDAPTVVAGAATDGDDDAGNHASNDQDMTSPFANLEAVGVANADDEVINDQDMAYQHTLAEAGAVGADAGATQQAARSPPAGLASPLLLDVGAEPTDGDGPVNSAAQVTPDTNNATAQDVIDQHRDPDMKILRDVLSKVPADDLLNTVGHFMFAINTLARMPELAPDVRRISWRARADMAMVEGDVRIEKYSANAEIVRRRLAARQAMAEADGHAGGDAQGGDAEEANGDGEQQDASAMEM
ncbi:hypothetical protein UCRNP2_6842 [Neofusicoccum parvum UCRNP2]|uniref:Uncharacterized protein n=1 Tax=Botryosphaeria parva (strain UCR-NP2) TaxID=1287680 RepID=R1EF82_BOTPV|nr:hypothetical protein UCRNP2_6842 [Neofusicoccum parvum UCRNP2]